VHMVTGHPGHHGMSWHRLHSINAAYTPQDAETPKFATKSKQNRPFFSWRGI
jgi:hypothetical protein